MFVFKWTHSVYYHRSTKERLHIEKSRVGDSSVSGTSKASIFSNNIASLQNPPTVLVSELEMFENKGLGLPKIS